MECRIVHYSVRLPQFSFGVGVYGGLRATTTTSRGNWRDWKTHEMKDFLASPLPPVSKLQFFLWNPCWSWLCRPYPISEIAALIADFIPTLFALNKVPKSAQINQSFSPMSTILVPYLLRVLLCLLLRVIHPLTSKPSIPNHQNHQWIIET